MELLRFWVIFKMKSIKFVFWGHQGNLKIFDGMLLFEMICVHVSLTCYEYMMANHPCTLMSFEKNLGHCVWMGKL